MINNEKYIIRLVISINGAFNNVVASRWPYGYEVQARKGRMIYNGPIARPRSQQRYKSCQRRVLMASNSTDIESLASKKCIKTHHYNVTDSPSSVQIQNFSK